MYLIHLFTPHVRYSAWHKAHYESAYSPDAHLPPPNSLLYVHATLQSLTPFRATVHPLKSSLWGGQSLHKSSIQNPKRYENWKLYVWRQNSLDDYGSPSSRGLSVIPASQYSHPYPAPSHSKVSWCDPQNTAEVTGYYIRLWLPSWAFSLSKIACFGGKPVAMLWGHSGAYEEAHVVRNHGLPTCPRVGLEADPPSPDHQCLRHSLSAASERPWTRIIQRNYSWIPDPQNLFGINVCSFKLLSFGCNVAHSNR